MLVSRLLNGGREVRSLWTDSDNFNTWKGRASLQQVLARSGTALLLLLLSRGRLSIPTLFFSCCFYPSLNAWLTAAAASKEHTARCSPLTPHMCRFDRATLPSQRPHWVRSRSLPSLSLPGPWTWSFSSVEFSWVQCGGGGLHRVQVFTVHWIVYTLTVFERWRCRASPSARQSTRSDFKLRLALFTPNSFLLRLRLCIFNSSERARVQCSELHSAQLMSTV